MRLDVLGKGVLLLDDGVDDISLVGGHDVLEPGVGEGVHLRHIDAVSESSDTDVQSDDDLLHLHGLVLALLEELIQTNATV